MNSTEIRIPDGMVLIKKGGRPRADAKHLAVFLTRLWRTEILGEQVKQADAWILEHWNNAHGITEESTIRRAIRSAKEGPLTDRVIRRHANYYDPRTGFGIFEGPVMFEVCPIDENYLNGATMWTWKQGMKYAHQYIISNPVIEFVIVDKLSEVSEERLKERPLKARCPDLPGT